MRLIEIKEKHNKIAIPKKIADEIRYCELDTIDADSPDSKKQLVADFENADWSAKGAKVPLSPESLQYLLNKSIPNLIDIAKDNLNKRLVSSLQRFQARLHAKLTK